MIRIAVVFMTLALSLAYAKSQTVNLLRPAVIAGSEIEAGRYRLDYEGDTVVLQGGGKTVEAKVTVEKIEGKNPATTFRFEGRDGKYYIVEIRLRGTDTRLVVD